MRCLRESFLLSSIALASTQARAQFDGMGDFAPLRPTHAIPLLSPTQWTGLTLSLVVALAVAAWLLVRRRGSATSEVKINPLNEALDALHFYQQPPQMALAAREYSIAVSGVLRRYIELASRLPAQEQTSEEFLASIQSHPWFSTETRAQIADFLEHCDLAKFARQSFQEQEKSALVKQAREIVESIYRSSVAPVQKTSPSAPEPTTPPRNANAPV